MIYVIDTNSFCVMDNFYPSVFVKFWEHIDWLVMNERLISTREVLRELEKDVHRNHVFDWACRNKNIFQTPSPEETKLIRDILSVPQFSNMIKKEKLLKGGPAADPWLVSLAKTTGGCLVTEESDKPNSAKIPTVCKYYDISCTNLEGMLKDEGWEF